MPNYDNLTVDQLKRQLAERDSLIEALRKHEIDAVVGDKSVAMLRLWEVERELAQRTDELERRNSELSRLNRELEALSYSVSHDLRNPLHSILALLEVLEQPLKKKLDEDERKYVSHLRQSAVRMHRLLDGTLRLFKVGRRDMQFRRVNLTMLATRLAAEIQATHPKRTFRFRIDDDLVARGDEALLTQVLQNLFDNAVRYAKPQGDIIVELRGEEPDDDRRIFYVRDNGVGFDMKHYTALFAAFDRLGKKQDSQGTGVGLAIVQRIVHRHGGELWAEGKVGKGATFYFRLPVG